MSKQYLSQHTLDTAHPTTIFALAATPTSIITGSGSPDLKVHTTQTQTFELVQVLKDAHPLGTHHLTVSRGGYDTLVSVGFGGEAKIWRFREGIWREAGRIAGQKDGKGQKAGELWAVCLDTEGKFLAGTTYDGRVSVWELVEEVVDEKNGNVEITAKKFAEWETRGGYGLAIDISPSNALTAISHPSSPISLFSTRTSKLRHTLPTPPTPTRTLSFSPLSTLLATGGDSCIITLYSTTSGETVTQLRGHEAWITSLSWSHTGEWLVSGSLDGKVKVWSVERGECVFTGSFEGGGEGDGATRGLWGVCWLPRGEGETSVERGRAERFVVAGGGGAIGVYREASGAS